MTFKNSGVDKKEEKRGGVLSLLLLFLIFLYRNFISSFLHYLAGPGSGCRFYPSCSCYAEEAIKKYGPLRGVLLALLRLVRCHPWNRGGYDPLPEKEISLK